MSPGNFRDRLRRLRREEGLAPASSPESLAEDAETERPQRQGLEAADAELPSGLTGGSVERTLGDPADLESLDGGQTWARKTVFPVEYRHGSFELREVRGASCDVFVLLRGDPSLAELRLEDAVYLDSETTGLSGGAGTYVFMVGLGTFRQDAELGPVFEVWQGFLRGPAEESALLEECSRRIRARSAMVSFFGKSFDRHRLEDKMRLCSVEPPFAERLHLDLYHPCRRLYRSAYEDGRLKTLERELCGLQRPDDLPGSMAPEAWFDYLGGRAHQLEGVFRHNLDDVLSLVALAAHLGRSTLEARMDDSTLPGDDRHRAAGLARSHLKAGARTSALPWLELALERGHPERRELEYQRAEVFSRLGGGDAALQAWQSVIGAPEDRFTCGALIELAKLLEHERRDLVGALETVRVGLVVVERTLVGRAYASTRTALEKRRSRLEAALAQAEPER